MKRRGRNNKKEVATIIAGFGLVVAVSLGISAIVGSAEKNVPVPQNEIAENFNEEAAAVDSSKNALPKTDSVIKAEELERNVQTKQNEETPEEATKEPTAEASEEAALAADEFDEVALMENEITLSWPLKGEIALDFSTDAMVFDPTLEQFRTNDSVCILAEEGADVASASDGTVESVNKDYEKGMVVVINHADGWSTTYSQLSDNVAVNVGNSVERGDVIGQVAMPTKYGAALGPHLEFKITQGNFAIDPKVAIAE